MKILIFFLSLPSDQQLQVILLIKNDFQLGYETELDGCFNDLFTSIRGLYMYSVSVC